MVDNNNNTNYMFVYGGISIVFLIFFVTIFAVTIYFTIKGNQMIPPPQPATFTGENTVEQINYGAYNVKLNKNIKDTILSDGFNLTTVESCINNNGIWEDNTCRCDSDHYGPYCSLEKHDNRFLAVGNIDSVYSLSLLSDGSSLSKSLGEDSCSNKCINDINCTGFIYENKHCTLLNDKLSLNNIKQYKYHENNNLYIKDPLNIYNEDKVYLGGYKGSIPKRFWLADETDYFKIINVGEIRKISYYPRVAIKSPNVIGIYSLFKFDKIDIKALLQKGLSHSIYIHKTNDFKLPINWLYKKNIYVIYVPIEQYYTNS